MRVSTALRGQRGIALLEAMIAIVIVALGILGVLGVQLRTLSDTQTAVRRAQAIRLIEDLSERMKVNPSGLAPGVMDQYVADWGDVGGAIPDCTNGCTAGNLARFDVAQWKAAVRATMPLGDANVFLVADTTDLNHRALIGVMVSWRENERERAGDSAEDTAGYKAPFATGGTGDANVSCPENRICHLQFIQPTLRCTPYMAGNASDPPVICP